VTNAGKAAGREVVQVYASYPGSAVERCERELKGFAKTKSLKPGETVIVTVPVTLRDLAYFDELTHRFTAEAGAVEFLVGASSRDVRARAAAKVEARVEFCD
jgi:beta-glucosidase